MRSFDVEISGTTSDAYAPMKNAFARVLSYGGGSGASIAVYRGDELVVDLFGGEYEASTLQLQFSVAKAITALTVGHAESRGLIDLDEPLSGFWGELDRSSTRRITARMVLAHTSGLAGVSTDLTLEDLIAGRYVDEIGRQEPFWEPGTRPGYHSYSFGVLLDEVFKRKLGETIGQYFDRELRGPLDLDVWYGARESDLSRIAPYERAVEGRTPLSRSLPELRSFVDRGSRLIGGDYSVANRPDVLSQAWPSMSVVATSRSLAKLLAATLTAVDGFRVLSPDALSSLRREHSAGIDWVLQEHRRFGAGVQLSIPLFPMFGRSSFGHQGAGGCFAFADVDQGLSVAYSTNAFPACEGGSLVAAAFLPTIQELSRAA